MIKVQNDSKILSDSILEWVNGGAEGNSPTLAGPEPEGSTKGEPGDNRKLYRF